MTQTWGHGLIQFVSTVYGFGAFLKGLRYLKNQLFTVIPLRPKAQATIYAIEDGAGGNCTNLFPKYMNEGHFPMENELYVHKENDLSQEYKYSILRSGW